jgi:Restriction endonuclease
VRIEETDMAAAADRIALFAGRNLFGMACMQAEDYEDGHRPDPATDEVLRLMRTGSCRYCGRSMDSIYDHEEVGRLLLCRACGYWGGRGTRELGHGPYNLRGVLGAVSQKAKSGGLWNVPEGQAPDDIDLESGDLTFDQLLSQLQALPSRLLQLSPQRAEVVVMDLLAEVLECEVRHVGGVHDGGVDGYIVAGDRIRSIVQVKWHRDTAKAERVGVVREIAGTLLARGVPNGLLVTTSERLSSAAEQEINTIGTREITRMGRMSIDTATYSDLLDMLELAWARRGDDLLIANPWLRDEDELGWLWDRVMM